MRTLTLRQTDAVQVVRFRGRLINRTDKLGTERISAGNSAYAALDSNCQSTPNVERLPDERADAVPRDAVRGALWARRVAPSSRACYF